MQCSFGDKNHDVRITPLHRKVRGDFERSKDKNEKAYEKKKQILLVSIGVLSLSHASPHQSTSPNS